MNLSNLELQICMKCGGKYYTDYSYFALSCPYCTNSNLTRELIGDITHRITGGINTWLKNTSEHDPILEYSNGYISGMRNALNIINDYKELYKV